MRLISIGFGFLVFGSTRDQQGRVSWQTHGFQSQAIHRRRPTRQFHDASRLSRQRTNQKQRQHQHSSRRSSHLEIALSSGNDDLNPYDDNDDNFYRGNGEPIEKRLPTSSSLTSSYQTALCVVPPDESWDTIQRARHFADDKTYHQWPPAIRLFHPFCPQPKLTNMALDLAAIIEKYNIEPFDITLSQWTVMPLPDTLQSMLEEQEKNVEGDYDHGADYKDEPQYQESQALIAEEERKGKMQKKNRLERLKRRLKEQEIADGTYVSSKNNKNNNTPGPPMASSSREEEPAIMEAESETIQPRRTFDEFNGPSMIALEPDEESSHKLMQLRELIRKELLEECDPNAPASVPSLYDTEYSEEDLERYVDEITSFRPLVPIGAYPTIDSALSMARKLKGFWDPLSFSITELHFISQSPHSRQRISESTEAYYSLNFDPAGASATATTAPSVGASMPATQFQDTKTQQFRDSGGAPFGCDAIVMLMGEEIEMDDESNELLAKMVWDEGTPGGFEDGDKKGNDNNLIQEESLLEEGEDEEETGDDPDNQDYNSRYETYSRKLDAKGGEYSDLLDWLDRDDEEEAASEDIGTDVVIGRTHMFSGEKRIYLGMPASSIVEEAEGTFSKGNVFDGGFRA